MSCSSEIAVKIKNLSKAYKIFPTPGKRLLYHLFGMNSGRDFYALNDVSFDIKKGEAFGIIGKNGSGKSTMLQILAGIIKSTSGELEVNGKIAALLELGSGFNPDSTGFENIYMNAAILGLDKNSIEDKITQIMEFADIGDFIHQPVKTYSSGMYIRLAFAVAINVDADIILIDEALAVGDVFFRQKCYSKLNDLKAQGKTIILVSHGMNEVEQFCDRAALLSKGNLVFLGDSREAVKRYYLLDQKDVTSIIRDRGQEANAVDLLENKNEVIEFSNGWKVQEESFIDLEKATVVSDGKAIMKRAGVFDKNGRARLSFVQGEDAFFYYEFAINEDIEVPLVGLVITDQKNVIVHGKDNLQLETNTPDKISKGTVLKCLQVVKMDLALGEYSVDIGINTMFKADYYNRMYKVQEEVNSEMERLCNMVNLVMVSVLPLPEGKPMKIGFHGCCNLDGEILFAI